jgi:sorbitol-specific phosphotransferase system component IIA
MQKLKINQSIRQELSELGIVICTYKNLNEEEFDGIDIQHQSEYPNLEAVEIMEFLNIL